MKNLFVTMTLLSISSSEVLAYNVIELDPNEYWVMSPSGTRVATIKTPSHTVHVIDLPSRTRMERALGVNALSTVITSVSDDGRYVGLTDHHYGFHQYSAASFDIASQDSSLRYLADVLGTDTYTRLIGSSSDGRTHLALQESGIAPVGSPGIRVWKPNESVRSIEAQLDVNHFQARAISSSGTKVIGELADSHGMRGVFIWEDGAFNYLIEGGRPLDFNAASADGSIILGTRYNPSERRYLPYRYTQESGIRDLNVFGADPYSGTFHLRGSDNRGLRILAQDHNYGSEEKCLVSEKGQAAYNLKTKLIETEGFEYLASYQMDCLKLSADGNRLLAYLQPRFQDPEVWLRTIVVELPAVCLSDFNNDGGVDGSDMSDFFQSYKTGDMSADLDQSGELNQSDIETFFESFEKGC